MDEKSEDQKNVSQMGDSANELGDEVNFLGVMGTNSTHINSRSGT